MMTATIRTEWCISGFEIPFFSKVHNSEVSEIMLNSEVISQIQEQIKKTGTNEQRRQIEYSEKNFSAHFAIMGMKFLAIDS